MADPAADPPGQAQPGAHLSEPDPAAAEAARLEAARLEAARLEAARLEAGRLEEAARIEAGRRLFEGEGAFFHAAQTLDGLPPPDLPEVAFAGRSNVGKSSLVNAVTGRRALARVSGHPGRTRQLNFFALAGRLVLVDMPGYGYARAARAIKEDWQGTMFAFLRGRPTLRRVVLLLDARVEVKTNDREVLALLDKAAVTYQLVLTKADALKPPALAAKQAEVAALARAHPAAHPVVLTTSSVTGDGIDALRATLAELARA
jgi:GTP-binding protein